MGPAHLHSVILCFCNRSASAPRSVSSSLAPSLSCWLPVLGSQRAGGGGCTAQGREIAHVGQSCFKEYIAGRLRGAHATTTFGRVSLATFFINDCGKEPPGRLGGAGGRGRAGAATCPAARAGRRGCSGRPVPRGDRGAEDEGSEDPELTALLSPRVSFCWYAARPGDEPG